MEPIVWLEFGVKGDLRRQVLVENLAPELPKEISREGFSKWALTGNRVRRSDEETYEYSLVLRPRSEQANFNLSGVLELVEKCGGHPFEKKQRNIFERSAKVAENLRKRHGRGWYTMLDFFELSTALFLNFLKTDELRIQRASSLKIILANILFLVDCFGLNGDGLRDGILDFARLNYGARGTSGGNFEDYINLKLKMARELFAQPQIEEILSALALGADEKVKQILGGAEKRCAEIASKLRKDPQGLQVSSYNLLAWNNFIHVHMLLLGVDNDTEITLHLLVSEFLEKVRNGRERSHA